MILVIVKQQPVRIKIKFEEKTKKERQRNQKDMAKM